MAEAEAIRVLCERDGDRWGSALIALMEGWAAVYAGENAVAILEPATDVFRRLGAGVLEAWARSLLSLALARLGAPEARDAALQAENLARYSGTPGARYFPYLALAEIEPAVPPRGPKEALRLCEIWVGETPDGDADHSGHRLGAEADRRAAGWAERTLDKTCEIASPSEDAGRARDGHRLLGIDRGV
jgi:hypothetical protein